MSNTPHDAHPWAAATGLICLAAIAPPRACQCQGALVSVANGPVVIDGWAFALCRWPMQGTGDADPRSRRPAWLV